MMTMKAASKSMDTLVRLTSLQHGLSLDDIFCGNESECSNDDEEDDNQRSQHAQTVDDDIAECDLFHTIVQYHPEEVFELAPLKPEEANECELADLFASYGSDISSLFEAPLSSTAPSVSGAKRSSCMVPPDWISDYDEEGDADTVISEFEDFEQSAKRARFSIEERL